tara:strand:- start:585 stop:1022 length:438 start_codon:yes stop_codon:yes gene_type:complete
MKWAGLKVQQGEFCELNIHGTRLGLRQDCHLLTWDYLAQLEHLTEYIDPLGFNTVSKHASLLAWGFQLTRIFVHDSCTLNFNLGLILDQGCDFNRSHGRKTPPDNFSISFTIFLEPGDVSGVALSVKSCTNAVTSAESADESIPV